MTIVSKSELKRLSATAPEVVEREFMELRARVQDQDVQIKQLRAELNTARESLRKVKAAVGNISDICAEFTGERI